MPLHNTLFLLEQLKNITKKYILVGEDISELHYPMEWHRHCFNHQPGGVFRGDEEWRILFKLHNLKLIRQYIICRDNDINKNQIYRCIYLLEKEKI